MFRALIYTVHFLWSLDYNQAHRGAGQDRWRVNREKDKRSNLNKNIFCLVPLFD